MIRWGLESDVTEDGEYVCHHFWGDGVQAGHDYLLRYIDGVWCDLLGTPSKRQVGERAIYFGPIPQVRGLKIGDCDCER